MLPQRRCLVAHASFVKAKIAGNDAWLFQQCACLLMMFSQDAASVAYHRTLQSSKHVRICFLNHPQCHLIAFVGPALCSDSSTVLPRQIAAPSLAVVCCFVTLNPKYSLLLQSLPCWYPSLWMLWVCWGPWDSGPSLSSCQFRCTLLSQVSHSTS